MAKKRRLTPQEQIDAAEAMLEWLADQKLSSYYDVVIKQAVSIIRKALEAKATPLNEIGLFVQSRRQQELLNHILDVCQQIADSAGKATNITTDHAVLAGQEAEVATVFALSVSKLELERFTFMDSHAWQAIAHGFVAGSNMPERLQRRANRSAQELRDILIAGLNKGEDSDQMAKHVEEQLGSLRRYTRNVMHNEIGRLYSAGNKLGLEQAATLGIRGRKTWYSNRDKRVRKDHGILDGHTIAYDANFEISGHTAPMPHEFGVASEDCNCRCRVHITREGDDIIRTSNGKDFDTLAEFKAYVWGR